MAEQFYTLVTNIGQQKIAASMSGGPQVELTHLAIGDGSGAYYDPSESQIHLKNEQYRTDISSLDQDKNNPNWFIADALIPDEVGGWTIREVGLFDKDGDLFAIGKLPETYKPLLPMGSDKQLFIRVIFQVSNSESVVIKVDPSIVLANQEFVLTNIAAAIQKLDYKASVRAATTTNITLSGLATLDGVRLVSGNRVLVKNQTQARENGIYIAGVSAWMRAEDADNNQKVTSGLLVMIEEGNTQAGSIWLLTTANPITLGTTSLNFKNILEGTITQTYADNTFLPLRGGSMAGAITLHADPSSGKHAATKDYIDNQTNTINTNLTTNYLQLAGGTMKGPILLSGGPTQNLHPTTKQYVDDLVSTSTGGDYLPLAGGTMKGHIVLSGAPTQNLHAATKQYVDTVAGSSTGGDYLPLSGGTITGNLQVTGACNLGGPSGSTLASRSAFLACSGTCEASGTNSAVIAGNGGSATAARSAILAATNSTVSTSNSAVIASTGCTVSNANNFATIVIASETCEASASRSGVYSSQNTTVRSTRGSAISGYYSQVNGTGSVLLSSVATRLSDNYAIGYGYGDSVDGGPSETNLKFRVNASGNVEAAGSFKGSTPFSDYAEFFENLEAGIIPMGTIVTLVGDRVRIASHENDSILGIITGRLIETENDKTFTSTAIVIGGDSPFTWKGRYLQGEFGETLYKTIPDPHWIPAEHPGEAHPLVTIPIENPDFNPEQKNIPRSHRPEEWSCVGLLGQVHVRVDETVQIDGFIQPSEKGRGTFSSEKTNLRCMAIKTPFDPDKGYGVAICLLK